MNRESVMIVAEKEYKEMFMNKGLLISLVVLVLVFGWDAGVTTSGSSPFPFDSRALYLSLFIGTFTGFMLAGTVFFREKQSGVIETVMATPLSLREIWLGKVIGISLPAYGMSLLSLAVMTIFAVRSSSSISGPSVIIIFHIVVVTPLFIMAAVGLLGYVQLAMGMKENRILTMVDLCHSLRRPSSDERHQYHGPDDIPIHSNIASGDIFGHARQLIHALKALEQREDNHIHT